MELHVTWMYDDFVNIKYLLHLLHIHAQIWCARKKKITKVIE